jgi:hypothetical protein
VLVKLKPMIDNTMHGEYNVKIKTSNLHQPLTIGYKQKHIKEITNIKFLSIKIDSCLTWKNHIDQVMPKLSAACYAVRMMYHIMNIDALKMIYVDIFTL